MANAVERNFDYQVCKFIVCIDGSLRFSQQVEDVLRIARLIAPSPNKVIVAITKMNLVQQQQIRELQSTWR